MFVSDPISDPSSSWTNCSEPMPSPSLRSVPTLPFSSRNWLLFWLGTHSIMSRDSVVSSHLLIPLDIDPLVHQLCIQAFQNESDNYARHQLSNVIASVSGLEGDWPELLPCLYTACTQSNPDIQCEGIYILGEMSDYCPDVCFPCSRRQYSSLCCPSPTKSSISSSSALRARILRSRFLSVRYFLNWMDWGPVGCSDLHHVQQRAA